MTFVGGSESYFVASAPMECAAEREFCSNFKCCNVALSDMHALFDHFERFHPSGRVPSPIPFWDDYRPSASSVVEWPLGTEECEDWAPREEDPPLSPATSDCSLSSSASSASSSTLSHRSFSTPEPQVLADAPCSIATGCVVPAAVPAPVPVSMSMTTFSLLQPREYVPQTEDVFTAPSPSSNKKAKRAKTPKGRARAGLPETEGAASILAKTLRRNLGDKVRAAAVVGESPEKADFEPPASASVSPTCHEFVLDLTPGSTSTTAAMDDILRSDPPKPVQYLNGQPKTYVCPVPQCFKAYLNPNGLRYHIEHGQCSDAHGAVCPPALTAPYRREYLAAHGSPSSAGAAGRLRAGSSKRGRGRYERTPVRQSPRFGKFRNGFAVEMELVRAVEAVRAAEVDAGSQSDSDSDSEMGTG